MSQNPMIESHLDPDWNAQYKRANVRSVLARCYVAIAEIDYDLREWEKEIHPWPGLLSGQRTINLRRTIDVRIAREYV